MEFEKSKKNFWAIYEGLEQLDFNIEDWTEIIYEASSEDVYAMAALVTVLNHRCWYWYEKNNQELSDLYSELYYKYNEIEWDWLEANGTAEEKHWYFETLD